MWLDLTVASMLLSLHGSRGIFRTAGQPRPLRKQSTTLTVSALQFLEALIEDEQIGIVDRYATGVILFATYSRSRFGDLRKISEIFIDEAVGGDQDSLGYLEATSASHKMRATGNRLGAHLPLVAPLKGVGPKSWGKNFHQTCSQSWSSFSSPATHVPNAASTQFDGRLDVKGNHLGGDWQLDPPAFDW